MEAGANRWTVFRSVAEFLILERNLIEEVNCFPLVIKFATILMKTIYSWKFTLVTLQLYFIFELRNCNILIKKYSFLNMKCETVIHSLSFAISSKFFKSFSKSRNLLYIYNLKL